MKRQKTIGEVVVNAFKNADKFLKKEEQLKNKLVKALIFDKIEIK